MAATVLEPQKKKTRLMTEGSIWKSILLFSVPLILGNLLQQLYNTADSIIVGNFVGSNALAAVGSSGSPIFLLIGFSQGIAVGAGVVVAQYLGAKDREDAQRAVHTALALAVAVVCAWQSPVFAHGSEAHMVPLDKTLQEFGADVQWDDYAQMFTLIKDGAYVKVKPGAKTAIVNGKSLDLPVPVVMKEGKAWVSDTFINDVFQSGLDQTFQVEKRPHPLNSLSAAEISEAVTIVKAAPEFQPNTRFTEISLHEPDKAAVWAFALQGTPVDAPRTADVVMLDGKHVIEAVVDLQNKKILSWTPIKGAHGMVLLDDFVSVQNIINASSEFAEVLKKHGITDPGKVVTTPLTVGFFDGKDGLQQDARLLKVVSYLDTGDGNYWAHPIENLVAVVDLEAKKIIKIEEGPVIPVPMEPRPYDGRDRNAPAVKPLEITEPEGKNYTITGDTISLAELGFPPAS